MAVLGGCAVPDKPVRPAIYDFGPGATGAASTSAPGVLPAITLAEIEAPPAMDGTAVLYRLAYADGQQLRPYALARWSMTPAQLLRQRLREQLGTHRVVLNPGDATASTGLLLRVELEEFSHLFESPAASVGLLRLRATLLHSGPGGDKLVAQRSLLLRASAPSADAAGGVRALTASADAAASEIDQWLLNLR